MQAEVEIETLYAVWQEAEANMHKILAEVKDDELHPDFIEAALQSDEALHAFLRYPTPSIKGVLLKLKLAANYDDYMESTLDEECKLVAPRAIVAAIRDLESLLMVPPPA